MRLRIVSKEERGALGPYEDRSGRECSSAYRLSSLSSLDELTRYVSLSSCLDYESPESPPSLASRYEEGLPSRIQVAQSTAFSVASPARLALRFQRSERLRGGIFLTALSLVDGAWLTASLSIVPCLFVLSCVGASARQSFRVAAILLAIRVAAPRVLFGPL